MIGRTIGHYEVQERLGGGGMGVVYRATDRKLGRKVALKFLSGALVESERAKQRFIAEARAASALDHPAIATIHAIDETPEGELYIVMAFYEGETIAAQLTRRGAIPVGQAIELALQAAEGLARAHESGIVHRDIKPANLMVTPEGRVKVLDFGLAKVDDVRLTDAGTTLGTPAYMSPEQARGAALDHRTDVWSLGVVLYEMLTGRLPFSGEHREQVLEAVRNAEPAPPSRWAAVPPDLERVVLRALSRSPGARQPSMAALRDELRVVRDARSSASSADTLVGPGVATEPGRKAPSTSATSTAPSGERRFVSVLACDVADILSLSEHSDPEELREVLARRHETGAAIVRELDGHLAKAEEGRLVAYFGYPKAHEDDAQRAVRAALRVVAELQRPPAGGSQPAPLLPRAAIHSGLMVAGDARDSTAGLVGNVPAIAARLVEGAEPGAVLVSGETGPLVERFFELESLGELSLPGLSRKMSLARVVRESQLEPSGVVSRVALTPLVGREEDLALLVARFQLAREGQGQAVLVSGEPGIGKSRLLHELGQRLRGEPHFLLECRSSPYHTGQALHPVIEMLTRLAGIEEAHGPEQKREQLLRALEPAGATSESIALLADALSLPPDEARSTLELTPQKRKQKTLEALLQLVLSASARHPVLLAVEDLHWLDPSTDEVLDAIVRQTTGSAVLVVATARPGTSPGWAGEEHVTRLALRRLSRLQTERLVERVAGTVGLPSEVVDQVLSRTDGVPLFAEELTRAVCDAALAGDAGPRPLAGALATLMPTTLQESLAARLDRLGPVKGTAQLAAVLGREFPLRWLEAVSPLSPDALRGELQRLVESGLLQPRGAPAASYLFKHALVQEAAYASLLKTTRQQYHEKVAQALEQQFKDEAARQPHLVAHHQGEAGNAQAAIEWWSRAAARAGERFASREALANLARALELLKGLPAGKERDAHELGLQLARCALLPSVHGYTSPETEAAYLRAEQLCHQAGRVAEHFFVHHGLWAFHLVCGRLADARTRAAALLEAGKERGDTLSVLDGHYALGCTLADVGEPRQALHHLEQGTALDEADPGRPRSYHAGMELGITTPAFAVMPLWLLGRPDAALERARRTADKARALGHPLSLAFALYYVAWAHLHRGEPARTAQAAREVLKLSEEHGLFFGPLGASLLGWALDREAALVPAWRAPRPSQAEASPASDEDFERVAGSLALYRASGAVLNVVFLLWLVALGHARRRRFAEARGAVAEALTIAAQTGETWWDPELLRLDGELQLAATGSSAGLSAARAEARQRFGRAGEIAARQEALSLELRAATSLLRLSRAEGRANDERALVAALLARFGPEGHATGDQVAARALLAELK